MHIEEIIITKVIHVFVAYLNWALLPPFGGNKAHVKNTKNK